MLDLEVIDNPQVASVALDPIRAQILTSLAEPGSATTVAERLGMTRQKVNYHLRTLEEHGLITFVEERPRRGLTERVMIASAQTYALSPDVLGTSAATTHNVDRLSSRYLIAVAARLIADVTRLSRAARKADQSLATLTIEADVRFASATERAEFSKDLAEAVASVSARYHNEKASGGRWHRVVVAAHPQPTPPTKDAATND